MQNSKPKFLWPPRNQVSIKPHGLEFSADYRAKLLAEQLARQHDKFISQQAKKQVERLKRRDARHLKLDQLAERLGKATSGVVQLGPNGRELALEEILRRRKQSQRDRDPNTVK